MRTSNKREPSRQRRAKRHVFMNGKRVKLRYAPIYGCDVRCHLPIECRTYTIEEEKDSVSPKIFSDLDRIPNGTRLIAVPPCGF